MVSTMDLEKEDRDSIVDDGDSTSDNGEWIVSTKKVFVHQMKILVPMKKMSEKLVFIGEIFTSAIFGFLVEKGILPRRLWRHSISLKPLDGIYSPVKGRTWLQYAQDMVKLSLRKYNALNETDVKLDHVVRVTASFCGDCTSYITFMARESEDEKETLVEYQAKVEKKSRRKSYPIFCRPSPKIDQDM